MFENPRRGRQARNFRTNVPKILDLKSSSEQIFFRKLSLGAPVGINNTEKKVVRIMTFVKYQDESRPLFLSLKLLNVYELNICLYIYIYID